MVFIISLRGQVFANNTSLTPSQFIEVPVSCQERARSYVGVRDLDYASFHDFVPIFWNYFNGVVFSCFYISLVTDAMDVWFVR